MMKKKDFILLAKFFAREEYYSNKLLIEDFANYLNMNKDNFDKTTFLYKVDKFSELNNIAI